MWKGFVACFGWERSMNISYRITLSRILLIPIFILVLSIPLHLSECDIAKTHLTSSHFFVAMLFIVTSATDWIDLYYARKHNLITNLGKFLDPLSDKLLVASVWIVWVKLGYSPAWVVIIIINR